MSISCTFQRICGSGTYTDTNGQVIFQVFYINAQTGLDNCSVRTHASFYWRTHDFGHAYHDTYAHFFLWFFQVFNFFFVLFWFWFFKNLMLYIWSLIYLFVLGRDRFFTVYVCFKETLFFNFLYKLSNKYFSLPESTWQFRVSVRK